MPKNKNNDLLKNVKDKQTNEQINENSSLDWAGKLFFAAIAGYILGKQFDKPKVPMKIKGKPEQIDAIVKVVKDCKGFQDEVLRGDASIDDVIEKLKQRNLSKQEFEKITGKKFPL